MKIKVSSEYKQLVDLFNKLTGSKNLWEIFNDCIEMYALAFKNIYDINHFEENEKRYCNIASNYTKEQMKIVTEILAVITEMIEENPFRDLLGNLYMQLNMGNDSQGQFFTPYSIAKLTAETAFDIKIANTEIKNKGYVTINEPSAGGGANMIAFCELLKKNGYNYQTDCIIVCQELNRLTAMMCYVVLSLMGCQAVIKIGDTLKKPFTNYIDELAKGSDLWGTPLFYVNDCYLKV